MKAGGLIALVGRILNLSLRFVTIPLLSKMCSDKTGGINDGLPSVLAPIFGMFIETKLFSLIYEVICEKSVSTLFPEIEFFYCLVVYIESYLQ